MRVGGQLAYCEKNSLQMTVVQDPDGERVWREQRGRKRGRGRGEKSRGQTMSDREEETILWAVREPFSLHSPVSMQMLLKERRAWKRKCVLTLSLRHVQCLYWKSLNWSNCFVISWKPLFNTVCFPLVNIKPSWNELKVNWQWKRHNRDTTE